MLKPFGLKNANKNVEKIYKLRYELYEAILEKERLEKEYQEAEENVDRIKQQIYDCVAAIKRSAIDFDMYEDN